jgi:hypothetical protein
MLYWWFGSDLRIAELFFKCAAMHLRSSWLSNNHNDTYDNNNSSNDDDDDDNDDHDDDDDDDVAHHHDDVATINDNDNDNNKDDTDSDAVARNHIHVNHKFHCFHSNIEFGAIDDGIDRRDNIEQDDDFSFSVFVESFN